MSKPRTTFERRILDRAQLLVFVQCRHFDSATELAEAVAHDFDEHDWLDDHTHYVWDAALSVFDEHAESFEY